MVEEVKGLLSRRRYLPYWLYSQVFRFRRYLDRKTFFQHLCYRKLLRVHRQDGSYLDERLFILEKP